MPPMDSTGSPSPNSVSAKSGGGVLPTRVARLYPKYSAQTVHMRKSTVVQKDDNVEIFVASLTT
eukprot:CAMPEP_0194508928 /NCGR_PEP_ID=MMETSP0253-20130528/39237_1 /TAXON_ID=2966 /ORGANISM="Noctiluca scintillans" /LENGTH=63 /DNA_ID=CAMNT_0039352005 /DNA_START=321 /DNA_END=512 /DNA_ORIENTATION=+